MKLNTEHNPKVAFKTTSLLLVGMIVAGLIWAGGATQVTGVISRTITGANPSEQSVALKQTNQSNQTNQNCLLPSASGCVMSLEPKDFAEYPLQIGGNTRQLGQVYVRTADYYAVHYDRPDAAPADAVASLEDGSIAIMSGAVPRNQADASISPVYRVEPGGSLVVPTGRVFVRFSEQTTARAHQTAIERAGYTIVDSPVYAPHAAWVAAQSGNTADALNGVAQLEAIPDIENVELQMLMSRSLK